MNDDHHRSDRCGERDEHAPDQRERTEASRSGSDQSTDIDLIERRAVEQATSEQLGLGSRLDTHGEVEPEPYPTDEDPADTGGAVIDEHRRTASRLERPPRNSPGNGGGTR